MSLTKDRYDVGDRIIARIPGYAMNYFGNVTRVLVRGGYTIRYDKCENRLKKQVEILNAQRQVKEYAYWTGCHFALVTDIKTIQIIDVSNVSHEINVIFECKIEGFENKFNDICRLICKERLKSYYEKLPLKA